MRLCQRWSNRGLVKGERKEFNAFHFGIFVDLCNMKGNDAEGWLKSIVGFANADVRLPNTPSNTSMVVESPAVLAHRLAIDEHESPILHDGRVLARPVRVAQHREHFLALALVVARVSAPEGATEEVVVLPAAGLAALPASLCHVHHLPSRPAFLFGRRRKAACTRFLREQGCWRVTN